MINKISIIGGPGSGKSTLAEDLGKSLSIPIIHIDKLYENSNWKYKNRKDANNKVLDIISKNEKYIIDGTYTETLKDRLEKNDLMIYLDFSSIDLLKGIIKRRIGNRNVYRNQLGWNERLSPEFIKYVINFNSKKREQIYSIIKENRKCVILRNRKEVEVLKKILNTQSR